MAAPLRTAPDRADAAAYQPLSLLAVLALTLAGLYTLAVVLLTVGGLLTRNPVLEPWLVLVAVIGAGAAVAARWQIGNSEGTLAGRRMANVALGLSVGFGCVYLAYYWGNMVAIRSQARDYVQEAFLKALTERKWNEAFLYTVEPAERKNMKPSAAPQRYGARVERFRSSELVAAFDRAGGEVAIESQGVRDISVTRGSYMVTLQYLVRTRAGEYEVMFTAEGAEVRDLAGRQWHIRAEVPFIQKKRLNTYGRLTYECLADAERFNGEWVGAKIAPYMAAQMYLDTEPLSRQDRARKYREYIYGALVFQPLGAASTPGAGLGSAVALGAGLGDIRVGQRAYFPRAADLAGRLVAFEAGKGEELPSAVRDEVGAKLLRPGTVQWPRGVGEAPTRLEVRPTAIEARSPVHIQLPGPSPHTYKVNGWVVSVCEDPALVAKMNELKSAPWDGTAPVQPDTTPMVLAPYKHDWRVARIVVESTRATEAAPAPPGAPGSGPPGAGMQLEKVN